MGRSRKNEMKYNPQIVLAWFKQHGLTPTPEYAFAPPRKWRFDFCFPEAKVALEVEGGIWTGGRHTRGLGFLKDMEKYSECAKLGWVLLRVTPQNLCTVETIQMVKDTLINRHQEIQSIVEAVSKSCQCQTLPETERTAMVMRLSAELARTLHAPVGGQKILTGRKKANGAVIKLTPTSAKRKGGLDTELMGGNARRNGETLTMSDQKK